MYFFCRDGNRILTLTPTLKNTKARYPRRHLSACSYIKHFKLLKAMKNLLLLIVLLCHSELFTSGVMAILYNGRVVCPSVATRNNAKTLMTRDPRREFDEISGLAISPNHKFNGAPVLYAIADKTHGPRLGVWDSLTGKRLVTLSIPGTENHDWESMSIGSCGGKQLYQTCIYIADTGDNTARQTKGKQSSRSGSTPYRIIKLKEPNYRRYGDYAMLPATTVSILNLDYKHKDSPSLYSDAESLFIDHTGWGAGSDVGDLYIVTKWDWSESLTYNRLFKIPASIWEQTNVDNFVYSPEPFEAQTSSSFVGKTFSSAEMSADGTLIALSDSSRTYLFLRCPGASVVETLTSRSARHCSSWSNNEGQMETSAWTFDGMKNLQIPEGANPRMGWTTLSYNVSGMPQRECPFVRSVAGACISERDNSVMPMAWCNAAVSVYPATESPSESPSEAPSGVPTLVPSDFPSALPSQLPSFGPSSFPSLEPSIEPSTIPIVASSGAPLVSSTTLSLLLVSYLTGQAFLTMIL